MIENNQTLLDIKKTGLSRENFFHLKDIVSSKEKEIFFKEEVNPLLNSDLELFYLCHIYSCERYTIPIIEKIEEISKLDDGIIPDIASLLVEQDKYIAHDTMLKLYVLYKKFLVLNPLFFLEALNQFKTYTPLYCELVLEWAESIDLSSEIASDEAFVGSNIVRTLVNSPVQRKESGKWCLKFIEELAMRQGSNVNLHSNIKPHISRSENNITRAIFKDKAEFVSYFKAKGQKVSSYFFYYYYDFSHLFSTKEEYLSALENLSGKKYSWYGSPNHLDYQT